MARPVRSDGRRIGHWRPWAAALLIGACHAELGATPGSGAPPALPPAELTGVSFEGYSGALQDVKLTAERARVDPRTRVALLEQVRIRLHEPERGELEVAAPQGRFDLASDDFVLSGGVEGRTEHDAHLRTSGEVRYEQATGRLISDAPVELIRNDMTLRGDGMEIDLSERRVRLRGGVSARLVPE